MTTQAGISTGEGTKDEHLHDLERSEMTANIANTSENPKEVSRIHIRTSSPQTPQEQACDDSGSDSREAWRGWTDSIYPLDEVKDYVTNKLHQACLTRNVGEVRVLVSEGVDVNEAGKKSWTPLHFGGRGGSAEIVQLLIDSGAKVEENSKGHSVWQIAAAFGFFDIVRIYGSLFPTSIFDKRSPLCVAAAVADVECIKTLLEAAETFEEAAVAAETSESNEIGLGVVPEVERLARKYHDVMNCAAFGSNVNLVGILLKRGAEVCADDLYLAMYRSPELVRLLLTNGGNPHQKIRRTGDTPFETCIEEGLAGMILLFVEHEKSTQGFISGSTLSVLLNSKQPQLYISFLFDALTMVPGTEHDHFGLISSLIPSKSLYTSCVQRDGQIHTTWKAFLSWVSFSSHHRQ